MIGRQEGQLDSRPLHTIGIWAIRSGIHGIPPSIRGCHSDSTDRIGDGIITHRDRWDIGMADYIAVTFPVEATVLSGAADAIGDASAGARVAAFNRRR